MIKVSCCMIVKDEERCLERCLNSIQDKVCEIILVDTGSTDKTLEIAKKFPKVKIYHQAWENNFGKARNYSISKATGDWILQLDADEEFVGSFPDNLNPAIYNFSIKNLTDTGSFVESVCARLVPNIEGMKYINEVHEIFASTKINLPISKYKDAHIVHDGYKNTIRKDKDKNKRNFDLLTKEYLNKSTPQICFYLGQENFIIGDYKESLRLSLEGFELLDPNNNLDITFEPILYHMKLSSLIELKMEDEIQKFIKEEYDKCNNPECSALLVNYFVEKKDENNILKYSTDLMSWSNAASMPVKYTEEHINVFPYVILGDYYKNNGNNQKALFFYELAHGNGLNDEKILGIIYSLMPKVPRLCHKWEYYCNKLYEKTKNIHFLRDIVNCLLVNDDENKNKQGINLLKKVLSPEEQIVIKNKLISEGKLNLSKEIDVVCDEIKRSKKKNSYVSVIIPTMLKASAEYMEYNLDELQKNKSVKEVIIIDNTCGDGSFDFSKYSKVKVLVQKENIGVNPAWNLGVKEAQGDYFLLLNDDCLVSKSVVDDSINVLDSKSDVGLILMTTVKMPIEDYKKQKINENGKIKIVDFNYTHGRNPNGWFIFGRTKDYTIIPNEMKIFYGDELIHYNTMRSGKRIVKCINNFISHEISITVNSLGIYQTDILLTEGEWYKNYIKEVYGDDSMVKYIDDFINLLKKQKEIQQNQIKEGVVNE